MSVNAIPAEDEGRTAEGNAGAVAQRDAPDGLPVDESAVRGSEIDQDDLTVLHPQLSMMAGYARVDQAQVAVGSPAQDGQRSTELVGALRAPVRAGLRPGDEQPRRAGEVARRVRQITCGPADLAVLDRGAPDDAGPHPERSGSQVRDSLEPHPHRPDER